MTSVTPISRRRLKNEKMEEPSTDTNNSVNWSEVLENVGRNRSEACFSRLYAHFSPLIKGFVQSNVSMRMPGEAAEELVQEVMIKVWQKSPSFDSKKAAASTWIFTITRNARIDYIRKHARHTQNCQTLESEDIWDEYSENQPFVYLQQVRNDSELNKRLAKLPKEQELCLRKVYMEGKSHAEIAEEMTLPLGTVKSRVRLGLKRLQANREEI